MEIGERPVSPLVPVLHLSLGRWIGRRDYPFPD
jgi:hypothetical protein